MIDFKQINSESTGTNLPDLTPLLDVIFLLLVFFLLTTYLSRPAVTVDLPEADNTGSVNQDRLSVAVSASGDLSVDGKELTDSELETLFRDFTGADLEKKEIYILADRMAPFERVIAVMDRARSHGIHLVSFLVDKK
ncbi:MAG: biopolymer transporter ExbD [Spirochaetales bacterium]|nr:biopolymer transporter ExbD [Spirochaetales bacterium]